MIEDLTAITLRPCDPDHIDLFESNPIHERADIIAYSGPITRLNEDCFVYLVERVKRHDNLVLILTTYGGDVDAAYRIAKFVRNNYKHFTLCVFGFCKSAGTLMALSAHEIVMGPRAELGPLDIQVYDPDEFVQPSSGLSIHQALESSGKHAFELFERIFLDLRGKSHGIITTRTAGEIAAKIVVGLYAPITQQIDCTRVGEMQRSLNIVIEYGKRLGASEKLIDKLARDFPSHSFAIDKDECKELFTSVRNHNHVEDLIWDVLEGTYITKYNQDFTRYPSEKLLLHHIIIEINKDAPSEDGSDSEGQKETKGSPQTNTEPQHQIGSDDDVPRGGLPDESGTDTDIVV